MQFNSEKIERIERISCNQAISKPCRLDSFLFDKFPDYSRSYFQKLVKQGFVSVNSILQKKVSYFPKDGDVLEIKFPEIKQFDLAPKPVDFEIVDIQKDFVIINKPAGLLTHHSESSQGEVSLVNGLLYRFKELQDFDEKERPGIVHRLDRGTSGLMVIARNQIAQIKFSNMFRERLVNKSYLAIVKGHPEESGKIDSPIGRHPKHRNLMSHVSFNGKQALTYFNVLKYYKTCSLVSVKIVTGRTHQIRVHFASIGHGLIGDELYGFNSKLIGRPALHSHKLSFSYNNKCFEYVQDVPSDIKTLQETLENPLK